MHLSIVIPAYNEAARIGSLLEDLAVFVQPFDGQAEVVVVDDGSTDDTCAVVAGFEEAFPHLRVISLPSNRGKGAAVGAGMVAATGAWRVFLDADGATPPEEIDRLLAAVDANPRSVAIASLRAPGADVIRRQTPMRSVAGRIGNAIIRRAVLPGVQDSQRGCKLFPGPLAERVFPEMQTEGWAFDIDVLARCRALGYDIVEVPVRWQHVDGGVIRPSSYLWTLHEVWSIRRSLRADGICRAEIAPPRRRARGLLPLRRPA